MWISIISAAACLAVTVALFLPKFINIPICKPIAGYFFFESVWTLVNYIILQINPSSSVPQYIHYIGSLIFAAYILFCLLFTNTSTNKKHNNNNSSNTDIRV